MAGLRKYIRPYYSYMLLAMFIKFFGALVELLIPYLLETILDDVVPTGSRRGILLTGGAMVLCAALCVTANIVANRMSAISAGKITLVLRHDLFQRLDRLSARQLDGLTLPSAVSRLTSDTYNVNQLLARMQRLGAVRFCFWAGCVSPCIWMRGWLWCSLPPCPSLGCWCIL